MQAFLDFVVRGLVDRPDAVSITPLQIVVAGVIGAALFVLCLVVIVQMVTR